MMETGSLQPPVSPLVPILRARTQIVAPGVKAKRSAPSCTWKDCLRSRASSFEVGVAVRSVTAAQHLQRRPCRPQCLEVLQATRLPVQDRKVLKSCGRHACRYRVS
jgi:hypothetical protein